MLFHLLTIDSQNSSPLGLEDLGTLCSNVAYSIGAAVAAAPAKIGYPPRCMHRNTCMHHRRIPHASLCALFCRSDMNIHSCLRGGFAWQQEMRV